MCPPVPARSGRLLNLDGLKLLGAVLAALLALPSPGWAGNERGTLASVGESETIEGLAGKFEKLEEAEEAEGDVDQAAYAKAKKTGFMTAFKEMMVKHKQETVDSVKVSYHSVAVSVDGVEEQRKYSGRVYLPGHKPGTPPRLAPLVLYQHATELGQDRVPSKMAGEEGVLGALAAELCGFVVAMPDGDGMGIDKKHRHAYCQLATTTACALDMIRAVLGPPCDKKQIFDNVNYTWNGHLYIVGYSEGGYISLASVRELAKNPEYKELDLDGAACMGGPFDLADAIHDLLHTDKPYYSPYIPAYFIATWEKLMPREVSMDTAINASLLKVGDPGKTTIKKWLDGSKAGGEVTPWIQARLSNGDPGKAVPARKVLNSDWIRKNIENPDSPLMKELARNTLVGGQVKPWAPPVLEPGQGPVPVLLMHDTYDETVNSTGSEAIYKSWQDQKIDPIGLVKMDLLGKGTGHVGGAIVAVPCAFLWIGAGMPRDFKTFASQKILDKIAALAPKALEGNARAWSRTMRRWLTGDTFPNEPEFRLSKIVTGGSSYTVTYKYPDSKIGKVKFYTLQDTPVTEDQVPNYQVLSYTRLFKELDYGKPRKPGDVTCVLRPNSTYYMAVYPKDRKVHLALLVTSEDKKVNMDLLVVQKDKGKIINRKSRATLSMETGSSAGAMDCVTASRFEDAEKPTPFIRLP